MKPDDIKTVYDLMRYCRMPLYFQREIRDMKLGDIFFLGSHKELIEENEDNFFIAEAWIEKKRGIYNFYGTWTFPTKPRRPFIMTFGDFKIIKGGIIEFTKCATGVKEFALICRYINFMINKMSIDEKKQFFLAGSKPLFRGIWLDKNYICRKRHFDKENQRFCYLNYEEYAPTQPLAAIVSASILLGILNF